MRFWHLAAIAQLDKASSTSDFVNVPASASAGDLEGSWEASTGGRETAGGALSGLCNVTSQES